MPATGLQPIRPDHPDVYALAIDPSALQTLYAGLLVVGI
jgi:hypothetical protein